MKQISENKWMATFGEYIKWYLFAPSDRNNVTNDEVAKRFAKNCDNGGYDNEKEDIACVLGLQDEKSKNLLSSYSDVIEFVKSFFDCNVMICCLPEKFNYTHFMCVEGINIELQSNAEPFDDEEFAIYRWEMRTDYNGNLERSDVFSHEADCYQDMLTHALDKIQWAHNYVEDFNNGEDGCYSTKIHHEARMIIVNMHTGVYTYRIVKSYC